jgi:aspartyl-tRNA(Asn)/glutamyl-tRNA(Gln) amidotransferase subunit A
VSDLGAGVIGLSALELARLVRSGQVSASEVTEAYLRRIDERTAGRAFITVCHDYAVRRSAARPTGPLAGVPMAVKDMFRTAGVRTTYGSAIFRDYIPRRTATAVRVLESAGAILVGKANQHEFAWGVTSQNPHWGTVENPVRPGRVAGGSSGGNAAALADGLCAIGIGTDTGGSVRIPAACCDVVGFRPPIGAVSKAGTLSLAPSFDTVGPMARSVRDCALVYSVLTGRPVPRERLAGLRVGVLQATGAEDELEALGAHVEEVRLAEPDADLGTVLMAEAAMTHAQWYPSRRSEYGPDAQAKWDAALRVTAVEYYRAKMALRRFRREARIAPLVDLLVCPTLAIEPPPIDCWEPDVRAGMHAFTRTFSFLGWSAIAIGNLQLAGRDDQTVLGAALAWEHAHPMSPLPLIDGRPAPTSETRRST